jgi:hypothetical protein
MSAGHLILLRIGIWLAVVIPAAAIYGLIVWSVLS